MKYDFTAIEKKWQAKWLEVPDTVTAMATAITATDTVTAKNTDTATDTAAKTPLLTRPPQRWNNINFPGKVVRLCCKKSNRRSKKASCGS